MKKGIQRFGKFLSAMVMPNIGAFIAWGFITALFIEDGWLPNAQLASIQPYMLYYLLPILIAATGGKLVGGERGLVMGAIAVVGCIAGVGGTDGQPMLMAAMLIGPFAGWVIKMFDRAMENHMPAGFEMLINNFSVGILGMLVAILGYYVIGPLMSAILAVLTAGVNVLVAHNLLPLSAILIEPAKVLFLNNAINHGIFTPIGAEQAATTGKSIMYMLETNPGPGLGVLLAYWAFCKDKKTRDSAPGAIIIHFLGGIHEIYFPYILMNPIVIIAPILGNMAAIFWFTIMDCGLKGPASPGSIIAFLAMTPKDKMVPTIIGVAIATGISFTVAAPIVRLTGSSANLEDANKQMQDMKAQSKGQQTVDGQTAAQPVELAQKKITDVKKIIFACDAGMGSSAMGATKFRNRLKAARPDIYVSNTSVDNIPQDADIAVVQETLADRARASAPNTTIVTIDNFLADPRLDDLFLQLTTGDAAVTPDQAKQAAQVQEETQEKAPKKDVLVREGIELGLPSVSKEEAIRHAGELLKKQGCVDQYYVDAMLEREKLVTTYMGMGIAIPHGTAEAKASVKKTGIVFTQYPDGVDFGGEKAYLVIGIAGIGDEHIDVLAKVSSTLDDEEVLEKMKTTTDKDWILSMLS